MSGFPHLFRTIASRRGADMIDKRVEYEQNLTGRKTAVLLVNSSLFTRIQRVNDAFSLPLRSLRYYFSCRMNNLAT